MGLLLILPFLISGYTLCIKNELIRYGLSQYDGQLLYFRVAYYGVLCFGLALVAVSIFTFLLSRSWPAGCMYGAPSLCWNAFSTDYLSLAERLVAVAYEPGKASAKAYAFFSLVGLVTMLVPYPLSWITNYSYRVGEEALLGEKIDRPQTLEASLLRHSLAHSPLSQVLIDSWGNNTPIMVLMESRQVYVGVVLTIGTPTEASSAQEDFELILYTGGYIDKDTLEIVLDPRYSKDDVLSIYLRQKDIVSAARMPDDVGKTRVVPFPHRFGLVPVVAQESLATDARVCSPPTHSWKSKGYIASALGGFSLAVLLPKLAGAVGRVFR
jgi:hypothetical protein